MNATQGSNSKLSPEDRHELRMVYVGKLAANLRERKAILEEAKDLRKLAKADGFVLRDDIDFALRAHLAEDDETIAASLARMLEVASQMKLPVGFQMDLFRDQKVEGDEIVRMAGHRSGQVAAERKSPYPPGGHEDQLWLASYDQGQQAALEVWQRAAELRLGQTPVPAAEKADGEPGKRRGRPPGSKNKPAAELKKEGDLRPRYKRQPDANAEGVDEDNKSGAGESPFQAPALN